jgi:hypothetical protein
MTSKETSTLLRLLAFVAMSIALFEAAEASGAQLTLSWIDNANGTASFSIERILEGDTTFVTIAYVPPGVTSYVDTAVAEGSTYCYRVQAYDADFMSDYSNEACGSSVGYMITVGIADSGIGPMGSAPTVAGTGTVISAPDGINCRADCFATFSPATAVTLTAIADSGSIFTGWSGSCTGTGTCTVPGDVSVWVTANFCSSSSDQCQSQ